MSKIQHTLAIVCLFCATLRAQTDIDANLSTRLSVAAAADVFYLEDASNSFAARHILWSGIVGSIQSDIDLAATSGIDDGLLGFSGGAVVDVDSLAEWDTAIGLTGTADATTYLRGDGSWQVTSGGTPDDDSVTPAKMADGDFGDWTVATNVATLDADVVDSDQYVDGSIDHVHLADDVVSGATAFGTFDSGDFLFGIETGVGLAKVDPDDILGWLEGEDWTLTGTWAFGTLTATTLAADSLEFEGATADAFETTLDVVDPTADNAIDLPDASGTVALVGSTGQVDGSLGTDDTYESAFAITGTNAGEATTQWDLVYFDETDEEWKQADADATGEWPARGVGVATGADGSELIVLINGTVRNDAWAWTPGATLFLSDTAGGLTETAPSTSGDCVQVVGFALDADTVVFSVNNEWLEVE